MSKQRHAEGQRRGIRPNTFPTPNEHVDYAMEMLTSDEYKVLNFAIRHTWGWHVDQKAMALSMFTNGYGPYSGVGLSRTTVVKCLGELSKYKFLIPVGKADSDGQIWSVGLDPDLDGLQARFEEKKQQRDGVMAPLRAKKKEKSNQAVYDIDRSTAKTESGLSRRPKAVYPVDASKDTSQIQSLKTETTYASVDAPDQWPVDESKVSYPFNGDNTNAPAPTQTRGKTKRKDKDAPLIAPVPPTRSPAQERNDVLVDALGKAWGVPASKGDYGLYVKKARKLIADMPIEKFQAFCDWRKKEAGDFADKLTIATITENGWISKFLQWDAVEGEKERKRQAQAAKVYAQYPQIDPANQPDPSEYIQGAEREAYFARIAQFTQGKRS